MARLARVVVLGLPHHVTQRGNGRQQVFFGAADYAAYRDSLAAACKAAGVACWAWVAMPNHVHMILVPGTEDGLRAVLAPVNRRFAGRMNARARRTGHFWQGRYGSAVMDEAHLAAAFRYVLLNPVRAKLALRAADWRWSSARAYLKGIDDGLTRTAPMLQRFPDIAGMLAHDQDEAANARLRAAETIGRPVGAADFLARIETQTGRHLAPQKRGRKVVNAKSALSP